MCSILHWPLRFIRDVEKYLWQITRWSIILTERMGAHPPIQEQKVAIAIPSACVLVGRYVLPFNSFCNASAS